MEVVINQTWKDIQNREDSRYKILTGRQTLKFHCDVCRDKKEFTIDDLAYCKDVVCKECRKN